MPLLFSFIVMFTYILLDQIYAHCNHGSDELYLCMSLDSLYSNSVSGSISYDIEIGHNTYSYPYYYPYYTSCFMINDLSSSLCHNIYQNGLSTNQQLCMYNIANIAPIGFRKQTLRVPYKHNIGDYGEFTVYTANAICVTIINANMQQENEYYVAGSLYRLDDISQHIYFVTYLSTISMNPKWNQVICLPQKQKNDTTQIGINVFIVGKYGSYQSSTSTQNLIRSLNEDQSISISFTDNSILNLIYWESCDSSSKIHKMKQIQNTISYINLRFLLWLIIIASCTIFIVFILSFVVFKHSDPINYYAIIWVVLELWDFEADIGFTCYLYYFYRIYGDNDEFRSVFILFFAAAFFVIVPYASNLSYLTNLTRMWTHRYAAGSSKDWLKHKCGTKILLFVCLCCGGVHPALEICNSLLFPMTLFAMHLPYAEHVRIRTERFLTNVAFENFPFILIDLWFYILLNKSSDPNIARLSSSNYVFWGGVTSSLLSVVFSAIYFFSFRHQQAIPEADYKFSFELQSNQLCKTWIHSHWRLQIAIAKVFQVPSPILIIIDKCFNIRQDSSFASKRMHVEGRILKDRSATDTTNLNIKADADYQDSNARERKNCLLQLLLDTFDLEFKQNEVGIHHLNIERIATERVFDVEKANTIQWVYCWCTYCFRRDSPSFVKQRSNQVSMWSVPSNVWRRLSKSAPSVHVVT